MAAVSDNTAGVKLVSFCPGYAGLGIHSHKATTLLFEPETDEWLAIMEGAGVSGMAHRRRFGSRHAPLAVPRTQDLLATLGTAA